MPRCPNCARETKRTEDWACQWCGYPLLSRAYKKIDKTYRQLQEERKLGLDSESEGEPEREVEPETEPDIEPEPRRKPEPSTRSEMIARHLARPKRESEPEPEPEAELEEEETEAEEVEPEPEPEPRSRDRMKPPPRPQPRQEVIPRPAPPPEPEPGAEPEPAPHAELESAPEMKPEPQPEPEVAPVAPPNLETGSGAAPISVDQLNAAFQSDSPGSNSKLKDRTITLTGVVEKVFVREHLDIRYIVLTGTRKPTIWKVRCVFGKEGATGLTRLTEGQDVVVRGKYDGYGKNIIFKDCFLAD